MSLDRLVTMILRRTLLRLVGRGIDAGIDRAVRGAGPREEMTPEDRRRARAAKQTAKRARQAARLVRRLR